MDLKELKIKVAPEEFKGFKVDELATLNYEEYKSATYTTDIFVRCAICEEHVSMSSNDYRAQGVFICDKCKATILHIRKLLEDRGSVV